MAGSGKKEQKLASNESAQAGATPLVVQDPVVSAFVMPGAPPGLIPRVKLDTDQKTTIATWNGSLPTNPARKEFFRLQIARPGPEPEWETLQEHEYAGRASPVWAPLDFTIPSTFFLNEKNEGAFILRYEHENQIGATDHSNDVPIFIDKIPPNLAQPPKPMVFTVTPPIVDASFGTDDYLEATIPLWEGDIVDVSILYGWTKDKLPEKPEDMDVIAGPIPVVPGAKVRIPKAKIIEAGDGMCCGGYVLVDKAGNPILSRYELMSVALGTWPVAPLGKPRVTDATGGELLRSDIVDDGVMVNIPHVTNGKSSDSIVVHWGSEQLLPGTPVGGNPSSGIDIFVPWSTIWKVYGSATTGSVSVPVKYELFRGVEKFDSTVENVNCNLSAPGPVDPLPNPEPGNSALKEVSIKGKSPTANELIATDEDEEVVASIELVAPLVNGDTYQVMWDETPIGVAYVIDTSKDKEGDFIEIKPLDWDVIRDAGPSTAMPVWYKLTNAAHENPQEPLLRTDVKIEFLTFTLPEAEPLHANPIGIVWCDSLRWNAGGTEFGVEYRIPPSKYLVKGAEVKVTWNAYTDFDNPVLDPTAKKEATFSDITQEQADKGIFWLIAPYATHILPTYTKTAPIGKGEVTYTITGAPATPSPTNTEFGMFIGEGSCNVPPPPNP